MQQWRSYIIFFYIYFVCESCWCLRNFVIVRSNPTCGTDVGVLSSLFCVGRFLAISRYPVLFDVWNVLTVPQNKKLISDYTGKVSVHRLNSDVIMCVLHRSECSYSTVKIFVSVRLAVSLEVRQSDSYWSDQDVKLSTYLITNYAMK